jgi:hypothetical protein
MIEMPERVWLKGHYSHGWWSENPPDDAVEYIRRDFVNELIDAVQYWNESTHALEAERDDARRWAALWKRKAKAQRREFKVRLEYVKEQAKKSLMAARQYGRKWKAIAKHERRLRLPDWRDPTDYREECSQ